jgi:hypothetical protein
MSKISRRKFVTAGLAATAGVSGLAVAGNLAKRYGLIPPDSSGIYGPGETLTYAPTGFWPDTRWLVSFPAA